jgi:hypothetical protein
MMISLTKQNIEEETHEWLNIENIEAAARYPTTLKRMTKHEFENLARHGYETAHGNEIAYLNENAKNSE